MTQGQRFALVILTETFDQPTDRQVLGERIAEAIDSCVAKATGDLTAAYHDLCAVLGWAVDDKPATAEMVARAAKAVVMREQALTKFGGD